MVNKRKFWLGAITYLSLTMFGSWDTMRHAGLWAHGPALSTVSHTFFAHRDGISATITWYLPPFPDGERKYLVERSYDGVLFTVVSDRTEMYTDEGREMYSYKDLNLEVFVGERIYYRLKVQDTEGTYTFSSTTELLYHPQESKLDISPNPVGDSIKISSQSFMLEETWVKMYNFLGEEVLNYKIPKGAAHMHAIDLKQHAAGKYVIQLQHYNQILAKSFFKL